MDEKTNPVRDEPGLFIFKADDGVAGTDTGWSEGNTAGQPPLKNCASCARLLVRTTLSSYPSAPSAMQLAWAQILYFAEGSLFCLFWVPDEVPLLQLKLEQKLPGVSGGDGHLHGAF